MTAHQRMFYYCDVIISLMLLMAVLVTSQAYTVHLVVVNREANTGEITCWTCPNKTDNEACNNWAPDINCPYGHGWCRTVHRLDAVMGRSLAVDKQCVMEEHCGEEAVGCRASNTPGVVECVTCCNQDYCNEHVPNNNSAALRLSSYHSNAAVRTLSVSTLTTVFMLVLHWMARLAG